MPDFLMERELGGPGVPVAGVDEAGRGPWAGPVVAAAVVFLREPPAGLIAGLDDSKKLPLGRRGELAEALRALGKAGGCALATAQASVAEVDRLNVLAAAMLAMQRALEGLPVRPAMALIDGNRVPDAAPCPTRALVKGDARALSISAASIIAKVARDAIMADLDVRHPGYGWARNAGYGTAEHAAALDRLGVTCEHRRSFAPIAARLRGVG